jgi:hypothetical protein
VVMIKNLILRVVIVEDDDIKVLIIFTRYQQFSLYVVDESCTYHVFASLGVYYV